MLAEAEEILAFTAFPKEHWRQIWSNNPQELGPPGQLNSLVATFAGGDQLDRPSAAVLV